MAINSRFPRDKDRGDGVYMMTEGNRKAVTGAVGSCRVVLVKALAAHPP